MVEAGGQKSPIWRCDSPDTIGIDEIPAMGLIVFERTVYFVIKEAGIAPTTTISEAINNGNVVKLQLGGWLPKLPKYDARQNG